MRKDRYSILVEESYKEQLEALAVKYGKKYGRKPNVSAFICAIADGEIPLFGGIELSSAQVQAMMRAINTLMSENHRADAQMLCAVLLKSNLINDAIKQEVQRIQLSQMGWVQEVENYIDSLQPFSLKSESGKLYYCRYAEFKNPDVGEGRRYLVAWVDNANEVESNDLPDLAHNRSFRTDKDLSVLPISNCSWRYEGLDTINVCMHLIPGFRYSPKSEDVSLSLVDYRGEQRIEIVKKIYSLFWFFQTLQRYGSGAYIVSPQSVVDAYLLRLECIFDLYKKSL